MHQEIELYDSRVQALLESGQTLVEKCSPSTSASLRRSLENLSVRWENTKTRSSERKTKLEDALKQADSFHESLNSIIVWLTNVEKTLNNVKPVSRVVESCLAQIEQHKVGCRYVLLNNPLSVGYAPSLCLWFTHTVVWESVNGILPIIIWYLYFYSYMGLIQRVRKKQKNLPFLFGNKQGHQSVYVFYKLMLITSKVWLSCPICCSNDIFSCYINLVYWQAVSSNYYVHKDELYNSSKCNGTRSKALSKCLGQQRWPFMFLPPGVTEGHQFAARDDGGLGSDGHTSEVLQSETRHHSHQEPPRQCAASLGEDRVKVGAANTSTRDRLQGGQTGRRS